MSAIGRGIKNLGRNHVRTGVVILLLGFIVGSFVILVAAGTSARKELAILESKIRTVIELREAGAFGTGGFGGDKPLGEHDFSYLTLDKAKRIPSFNHIEEIEAYVFQPQIDPSKENAYAMIIGLQAGSALRAVGEIDYESAEIVVGRSLQPEDEGKDLAVVGSLYAVQRLGVSEPEEAIGRMFELKSIRYRVVGVYTTGNNFGDNHVFIPITSFQRAYRSGEKLGKIFLTVDRVQNVERVVRELKEIPEADVVIATEAVSTARNALSAVAATSLYGALFLLMAGAFLVSFVMMLITRERVREIGVLKALGASNSTVILQLVTEGLALTLLSAILAVLVAYFAQPLLARALGVTVLADAELVGWVLLTALGFGALGLFYPVLHGLRLSPVVAMRRI